MTAKPTHTGRFALTTYVDGEIYELVDGREEPNAEYIRRLIKQDLESRGIYDL